VLQKSISTNIKNIIINQFVITGNILVLACEERVFGEDNKLTDKSKSFGFELRQLIRLGVLQACS
jgi:hypothetical protein